MKRDSQMDPRAHHGGELGWKHVGGAVDWWDPREAAMAREEPQGEKDVWESMADGFRAAMWDVFADGVHPAEVCRRFFLHVVATRPERLSGTAPSAVLAWTVATSEARAVRMAELVEPEKMELMEVQLETWRRKGPGRVVRRPATPAPMWETEGFWFREGVGQWVDRAWSLGRGIRWAVRGVFVLTARLAPAALPMGVAEMASVFGTRKTAPDEWARRLLEGSGVRGRDQKRSRSCARMALAQAGNHNRANGARKEQILK